MKKKTLFFTFVFLFAMMASNVIAETLEGRVYESTTGQGISALMVKLIPPRNLQKSEKITSTNEQGEFRFPNIERGRYLIEVYQGVTILYRDVVEVTQDMRKEIPLRKK